MIDAKNCNEIKNFYIRCYYAAVNERQSTFFLLGVSAYILINIEKITHNQLWVYKINIFYFKV